MVLTNVRFTPCDTDLKVKITPLRDLNIVVETSLSNQPIFDFEESYEDNLEDETEESINGTIIIGNKILFKFEDNKK
jgi:hypothetical protein